MIGVGEILVGLAVAVLAFWAAALCWWDLRFRRLPNWLTLPAIPLTWFPAAFFDPQVILGGLGWSALYLALASWRGGLGGGDIKLAASLGVLAAWADGAAGVLVAVAAASVISLLGALLSRQRSVPHAPAMFAGSLVAAVFA